MAQQVAGKSSDKHCIYICEHLAKRQSFATSLPMFNRGGAQGLVLLPAVAILNLYMEAFECAEAEISRERELVADQAGAEAGSAEALASSLW